MSSPGWPVTSGGFGLLGSGEGFGPGDVGVSRVSRQDLKPGALAPDLLPVDADTVHCQLLASHGVLGL